MALVCLCRGNFYWPPHTTILFCSIFLDKIVLDTLKSRYHRSAPLGIHIWYNKYNWNEKLKIVDEAARAYYENTVFEVVSLELKSQTENEISFSACVSKGGIVQEPDRTIFLEFVNGHWEVVNEGYWYDYHILCEYCKNAVTDFRRASSPPIGSVWSLWLVCTGEPLENKRKGDNFSGSVQNRRTSS